MTNYRVSILTEKTILITLKEEISAQVNDEIIQMASWIQKDFSEKVVEVVPAFHSLSLVCFPEVDIEAFAEDLKNITPNPTATVSTPKVIEIPVCYDISLGIDLPIISESLEISIDEIVNIHEKNQYRVFMTGFMPGFLYLGILNEKIRTPRRKTPRKYVPAGSVAIANEQTGIYSVDSPGGWHIIGQTPVNMLHQFIESGVIARQGDIIKFSSIDLESFESLNVNG